MMSTAAQHRLAFHPEPHPLAGKYLREVVFAASDGLVTTFAVVAGATGGHLSNQVVIILGLANLVADGISMGLGEYLGSKSEQAFLRAQRAVEEREIVEIPEEEKEEVRQIFRTWGLHGDTLEGAVQSIAQHPKAWVDIMMRFELGLQEEDEKSPARRGWVMFVSFAIIGFLPLIAYLADAPHVFLASIALSAAGMFMVGALRAVFMRNRWWRAGIEMLIIGTLAAGSAYVIGLVIARLFQVQ